MTDCANCGADLRAQTGPATRVADGRRVCDPACGFALLDDAIVLEDDEKTDAVGEECPACPGALGDDPGTPPGYETSHCAACMTRIARRQAWHEAERRLA